MKAHTIGVIVLAVTKMRISTMLRSECDVQHSEACSFAIESVCNR